MNERYFQFDWDDAKAYTNARKHGVSFELARTVFNDQRLLTVADLEHSEAEERWFSIGCASNGGDSFSFLCLFGRPGEYQDPADFGSEGGILGNSLLSRWFMSNQPSRDDDMPVEIDFSRGIRGLHHIPAGARILMPASIERSVWEYFAVKAEQQGVDLSDLLTDVLKSNIQINETLK